MLLCAMLFSACASPHAYSMDYLTIDAPTDAPTGNAIYVMVYGETAQDGASVGLMVTGKNGPRALQSTFFEGVARFIIPAEYTRTRGYLALIAASGEAYGEASIRLNSQTLIASGEDDRSI